MDYSFDRKNLTAIYHERKKVSNFSEREKLALDFNDLNFPNDNYESFFKKSLLYSFFASNCLYGCIIEKGRLIFEFGAKSKFQDCLNSVINQNEGMDLTFDEDFPKEIHSGALGTDYKLFMIKSVLKESKAEIYFFIHKNLKLNHDSAQIIHSLIKRFYLNLPGKLDSRYKDFFGEFENRFLYQINSFSFANQKGVIANFYVQDLKPYFLAMGEHRSGEILEEIRLIILSYLKKGDLLFRISQRSFLTYSHNCTIEIVKQRFDDVYFQIKNLIVDYEIFFFPVEKKVESSEEFWNKIFPPGFSF